MPSLSHLAGGLTVALLTLAGCRAPAPRACDAGDCRGSVVTLHWDQRHARVLDLLFVVDPRALANDPARVRSGMRDFAVEVDRLPGAVHAHIAVVSSVLDAVTGEPVSLLAAPGQAACAATGPFLTAGRLACELTPNFAGSLDQALSCLAPGDGGGRSQPLEVARRMLDPARQPATFQGFLRASAVRVVVMISPRDDASAQPAAEPAALATYLEALSPTRMTALGLSIIAPSPSIDGGAGGCAVAPEREPPTRLLALQEAAAERSVYVDICTGDWRRIFDLFNVVVDVRGNCLPAGIRTLAAPDGGVRPDCVVGHTTLTAMGPVTALLPACSSGQRPCVEFRATPVCGDVGIEVVVLPDDCLPILPTALELVCAGP
jgi:hypothetical protein